MAAFVMQSMQYMASSSIYFPHSRHFLECTVQQFVSPDAAMVFVHPGCAHMVVAVPYLLVNATDEEDVFFAVAVGAAVVSAAVVVAAASVAAVVVVAAGWLLPPQEAADTTSAAMISAAMIFLFITFTLHNFLIS